MQQEVFGKFIAELRKERKLTQKELAKQLYVTDKAVSKWERGMSLPDIKLLELLAETLGISVYELMVCERVSEADKESVSAELAKKAVHETVVAAKEKQKRTVRVSRIIIGTLATLLLLLLLFGIRIMNFMLDNLSTKENFPYHTCEIQVETSNYHPYVGYYVYEERVAEYESLFHVMGLVEDGTEQEIFRLRQEGMRLQRAPKVLEDEKYLYVLFEGMDNEDGKERIYGDAVGTDVQGFLPFLYRYDKEKGQIEQIEIKEETTTLLLDAFTHEGESVWISQQFEGLLFGLHLGWYLGAEGYCNYGEGIELKTISPEGGLKTTGCYDDGYYYIVGQDGIHILNLENGKEDIISKDLGKCYRAELKKTTLGDGSQGYVVVTAMVTDYGTDGVNIGELNRVETIVTVYDETWQEIDSRALDAWCYAIEWGETSVLISDQKGGFKCHLVYFDDLSVEEYVIEDYEWSTIRGSLDELENQRSQWVYLAGCGRYVLTQTEEKIIEK